MPAGSVSSFSTLQIIKEASHWWLWGLLCLPVYLLSHFPGTECKKLIWHCAWAMKASIPKLFFLISLPQVFLRTIVSCWFKSDLFFIFTFHFFHFFIISFQYFCCCCLIVTCKQPLLCDSLNNCFQPFIDYFHFLFVLIPEFFGSVLTFISNENIQLTRSANFIWCLCCLNIFFNEPTTLNTFTLAGQCYLHSKQAKHAICFQCHHCLGHQWH